MSEQKFDEIYEKGIGEVPDLTSTYVAAALRAAAARKPLPVRPKHSLEQRDTAVINLIT
jgi:hypothetical protein